MLPDSSKRGVRGQRQLRAFFKMCGHCFSLFLALLFARLSFSTVTGHTTHRPSLNVAGVSTAGAGGIRTGGIRSVLEDAVSPAFGATIIIIITVIVSGSAYLGFLKYVCAGCCKPTQVAPAINLDPYKSEEQV